MKSEILTWLVSVVFQVILEFYIRRLQDITERLLVVLPFAISVWEIWGKLEGTLIRSVTSSQCCPYLQLFGFPAVYSLYQLPDILISVVTSLGQEKKCFVFLYIYSCISLAAKNDKNIHSVLKTELDTTGF